MSLGINYEPWTRGDTSTLCPGAENSVDQPRAVLINNHAIPCGPRQTIGEADAIHR